MAGSRTPIARTAAFVDGAVDEGVEVREHAPSALCSEAPSAVRVSLDDDELEARAVVVTAGAWAPTSCRHVGIELSVVPTRETVVYLELPAPSAPAR